ncbi:neural/ectodermal development factor IMP-L2 [Drosophila elegans]|uniref:neural/ectodermal development factor IMP-L2 n=1 Tax=Drosophila elegans TaxID=30023 RepID=UPI0007E611B4|nr:neural/ectodermal development factor IMP-L2 [Drosophila elegans]
MNLHVCALALLLFGSIATVRGRAVDLVDDDDSNNVDNSIEAEEEKPRNRAFAADWLKFIKTPPTKLQQAEGATVEIVCEMMGSSVPSIQWVVGHLPHSELDDLESNQVADEANEATIVRVRSSHIIDHMLSEARTYTCVGRTGSKTIYASTVVHPPRTSRLVPEKTYPGPQKPRIIYSEKTHLDLMGNNIMLPCRVHARPRAEITWLNNENKEIVQGHRHRVLPSGDLLISEIKWEDMGNYKCIARNAVGKDSADTFVYPVLREEE